MIHGHVAGSVHRNGGLANVAQSLCLTQPGCTAVSDNARSRSGPGSRTKSYRNLPSARAWTRKLILPEGTENLYLVSGMEPHLVAP